MVICRREFACGPQRLPQHGCSFGSRPCKLDPCVLQLLLHQERYSLLASSIQGVCRGRSKQTSALERLSVALHVKTLARATGTRPSPVSLLRLSSRWCIAGSTALCDHCRDMTPLPRKLKCGALSLQCSQPVPLIAYTSCIAHGPSLYQCTCLLASCLCSPQCILFSTP